MLPLCICMYLSLQRSVYCVIYPAYVQYTVQVNKRYRRIYFKEVIFPHAILILTPSPPIFYNDGRNDFLKKPQKNNILLIPFHPVYCRIKN